MAPWILFACAVAFGQEPAIDLAILSAVQIDANVLRQVEQKSHKLMVSNDGDAYYGLGGDRVVSVSASGREANPVSFWMRKSAERPDVYSDFQRAEAEKSGVAASDFVAARIIALVRAGRAGLDLVYGSEDESVTASARVAIEGKRAECNPPPDGYRLAGGWPDADSDDVLLLAIPKGSGPAKYTSIRGREVTTLRPGRHPRGFSSQLSLVLYEPYNESGLSGTLRTIPLDTEEPTKDFAMPGMPRLRALAWRSPDQIVASFSARSEESQKEVDGMWAWDRTGGRYKKVSDLVLVGASANGACLLVRAPSGKAWIVTLKT